VNNTVRSRDITAAVRALGLQNRPVCLHSSLRSFGFVEGDALTVIQGFLDEGCTVMVPTFTYENGVAPPTDGSPPQNGYDYSRSSTAHSRPKTFYSPDSTEVSDDMGALPRVLVTLPGRRRGDHPLDSFSAVGPLADALIAEQTGRDVYAPFRSLAEHGGYAVLMGVGLTRLTLLHEAEQRSGRNLFWRWAHYKDGETVSVRVGGCSEGFEALTPALAGLERTRRVGDSLWRVLPARETLDRAAAAIRTQPGLTHCDDATCERCRDAARGGPSVDAAFSQKTGRSWR
jgi:aminoglycoside N3'-acetyltransferase